MRHSAAAALTALALLTACGQTQESQGSGRADEAKDAPSAQGSPTPSPSEKPQGADLDTVEGVAVAYVSAWYDADCQTMLKVLVEQEIQDSFDDGGCDPQFFTDANTESLGGPVESYDLGVAEVGKDRDQTKVTVDAQVRAGGQDLEIDPWTVYLVQENGRWLVDDFKEG